MADGGASLAAFMAALESLAAWAPTSTAAVYGGTGVGSAAAAGLGTAAGAAGSGLLGAGSAGEAVSGAYGLTAEELAAINGSATTSPYVMPAGIEGVTESLPYGTGNTVTDSLVDAELTDFQKYLNAGQNSVRNVGRFYNKMPKELSGPVLSGLLGPPPQPGPVTNIRPPATGGTPQNTNPYSNRKAPIVMPYAPTLAGGQDAEEMKRRLMLMLRGASA